jgi:hypothetical protein
MSAEQHVNIDEEMIAYEEILEEYRRRQMIEHLTGPMISLVLHVVIIVACALLLAGKEIKEIAAVEFDIKEMDIKPLEPEIQEKLDELEEEIIEEVVPTVEKPTITPEEVSVQDTKDFAEAMAASEMDMDLSSLLDVKATKSPLQLSGLFGNRGAEARGDALRRHAGRLGAYTERAVIKALEWLKNHQEPNGSWSPKQYGSAMTGLALLTFLAHGETPDSEEYGETVQKAIQWLVNFMMAKKAPGRGYAHAIETYSLAEAYGLTKLPVIKPAMEKGLDMIVRGQQPRGGWDYNFAKGDRWDLSVSAWQMQALKAGYAAGSENTGINKAIEKSIEFVRKVTYKDGKFGYSSPGSGSPGMQGAGTLVLELLGEGKCVEAKAGVKNISENMQPVWDDEHEYALHHDPSYNWYYQTQAMFHAGTSTFREWNANFAPMMVKHQQPDGHWECPGKKSPGVCDPYYSTCLNALSLQVYYRYLPTYREPEKMIQKADVLDLEDEDLGL